MLGVYRRLIGHDAMFYAEKHGLRVNKYEDPYDVAIMGMDPEYALEILTEDPSLLWIDVLHEAEAGA